jgi:hypothetical protein
MKPMKEYWRVTKFLAGSKRSAALTGATTERFAIYQVGPTRIEDEKELHAQEQHRQ